MRFKVGEEIAGHSRSSSNRRLQVLLKGLSTIRNYVSTILFEACVHFHSSVNNFADNRFLLLLSTLLSPKAVSSNSDTITKMNVYKTFLRVSQSLFLLKCLLTILATFSFSFFQYNTAQTPYFSVADIINVHLESRKFVKVLFRELYMHGYIRNSLQEILKDKSTQSQQAEYQPISIEAVEDNAAEKDVQLEQVGTIRLRRPCSPYMA
jgi:hypothetical protein